MVLLKPQKSQPYVSNEAHSNSQITNKITELPQNLRRDSGNHKFGKFLVFSF